MTLFKKLFIASFGLMMLQTPAFADDDKPIQINQLPVKAQTILKNNFGHLKIEKAEMEEEDGRRRYEVEFTNGASIEFNRHGEWKEIECEKSGVPSRLVPMQILKHVKHRWPNKNVKILKIERKQKKYEVELSNDIEITFNQNFKVIDVDR